MAIGPIDYSTHVVSPFEQGVQGYKFGLGLQELQQQRMDAEAARQAKLQMQADIDQVAGNPNAGAADYTRLMTRYPQLSEHFKRSWDTLDAGQKQAKFSSAWQVASALNAGQPDVAIKMLRQQAEAARNSGMTRDADGAEAVARTIEIDPARGLESVTMMLAAVAPDKFTANYDSLTKTGQAVAEAPAKRNEAEAKAREAAARADTAQAEAGVAPTIQSLKVEQAREEVENLRDKRRLDQLNADIAGARNDIDRDRLKLERDKLETEINAKKTERGNAAQERYDTLQTGLDTIGQIKKHPGLDGWFGVGSIGGAQIALIPGTDAANFDALVDTLKSQLFLDKVSAMKGTGALTEAEGKKIETAIASLSRKQSPGQFKAALGVIESNMKRGQDKVIAGGNLPTKGGAFLFKSPTYGDVSEGDVNALLAKFPGSTREQVIAFLQGPQPAGAR